MANFKNKKLLMTLVAGLGGIGLIGTGFASWVISQNDQGESTGGIVADVDVQRSEVQIGDATVQYFYSNDGVATDTVAANNNGVMFGPNVDSVTNGWLEANLDKTPGDSFYKEALTVKITFPFKYKYANSGTPADVNLAVAPHGHYDGASNGTKIFYYADATSKTKYETALTTDHLVAAFPTLGSDSGVTATFFTNEVCTSPADSIFTETQITVDKDEFGTQLYLQFVVTFDWGTAFGGNNPMTFYNGVGKSLAADGDEATRNLGKLSTLTDCSYKLGFSVTA